LNPFKDKPKLTLDERIELAQAQHRAEKEKAYQQSLIKKSVTVECDASLSRTEAAKATAFMERKWKEDRTLHKFGNIIVSAKEVRHQDWWCARFFTDALSPGDPTSCYRTP